MILTLHGSALDLNKWAFIFLKGYWNGKELRDKGCTKLFEEFSEGHIIHPLERSSSLTPFAHGCRMANCIFRKPCVFQCTRNSSTLSKALIMQSSSPFQVFDFLLLPRGLTFDVFSAVPMSWLIRAASLWTSLHSKWNWLSFHSFFKKDYTFMWKYDIKRFRTFIISLLHDKRMSLIPGIFIQLY